MPGPSKPNKVPVRSVHRGPTLTYIMPRLVGVGNLKLIHVILGYCNLKLDEQCSYLTTFLFVHLACTITYNYHSGWHLLVICSTEKEMNWLKGYPMYLALLIGILIAGFDDLDRNNDVILDKVLRICREVNLRLSKDKCNFRYTGIPFF